MGELATKIFFRSAFVLAIMCFVCLWIVDPKSAEYYIVIFAGMINCIVVIIGFILGLRRREKKCEK